MLRQRTGSNQAAREFVHWRDELGMIRFRGALPPCVSGVAFVNRLDAETDREWRAAKREKRTETRSAHEGEACHIVGGLSR